MTLDWLQTFDFFRRQRSQALCTLFRIPASSGDKGSLMIVAPTTWESSPRAEYKSWLGTRRDRWTWSLWQRPVWQDILRQERSEDEAPRVNSACRETRRARRHDGGKFRDIFQEEKEGSSSEDIMPYSSISSNVAVGSGHSLLWRHWYIRVRVNLACEHGHGLVG